MEKQLTDNEIKKALECCSVQGHFVCNECPAFVNSKCTGTHKAILDLINRLQAEVKRLSTLADLGSTRANDYRVMRDRALKAEAENERLKGISDNKTKELLRYNASIEELHKKLETAKTEAYKEFAEKLENRILSMLTTATLEEKEIICACIGINNNVLKELVGEDNESKN